MYLKTAIQQHEKMHDRPGVGIQLKTKRLANINFLFTSTNLTHERNKSQQGELN